jgi:hypothetical protein
LQNYQIEKWESAQQSKIANKKICTFECDQVAPTRIVQPIDPFLLKKGGSCGQLDPELKSAAVTQ